MNQQKGTSGRVGKAPKDGLPIRADEHAVTTAAPVLMALLVMPSGCSVDDLNVAGKSCPCVAGWICDTATNTCVPAGNSAGDAGAGGSSDAGADSGPCVPTAAAWWDDGYAHRRQIAVTAGTAAVPAGYSVPVSFDHLALVSATKAQASGDDVRVSCGADSKHRALDPVSSWGGADTRLWFQLPAALAAQQSDTSCYLYYGNPSGAAPPDSWSNSMGDDGPSNVFLYGDDFEEHADGAHPNGWGDAQSGIDYTVVVHGAERWYRAGDFGSPIDYSRAYQMVELGDAVWSTDLFHREDHDDAWGGLGVRPEEGGYRFVVAVRNGRYVVDSDPGSALTNFDSWQHAPDLQFPLGSQGRLEVVTQGSQVSAFWYNPVGTSPAKVTLVEDYQVNPGIGRLLLYLMHTGADNAPPFVEADNVIVRHYVSPEPTVTLGCEETSP